MNVNLNLGSGYRKIPGWTNVDNDPETKPDLLYDLEQTPWPWESDSVDSIMLTHTLEHMGETPRQYLAIWKELWRVCKESATIHLIVPHWLHGNFINDPTHIRPITPVSVLLFDQEHDERIRKLGEAGSKLGFQCGVDFHLENLRYDLAEPWQSRMARGEISPEQMNEIVSTVHGACEQISMTLRVVKPCRYVPGRRR